MKSTKVCGYCGHAKEVDLCDTCKGSGYIREVYIPGTPPLYADAKLSIIPCGDCRGTGLKNGIYQFNK
jgi:DnaJ-class molecular chaperone